MQTSETLIQVAARLVLRRLAVHMTRQAERHPWTIMTPVALATLGRSPVGRRHTLWLHRGSLVCFCLLQSHLR
jgi:hypothetical protein